MTVKAKKVTILGSFECFTVEKIIERLLTWPVTLYKKHMSHVKGFAETIINPFVCKSRFFCFASESIGIVYATAAFGPVLGFLIGAWLLSIPSSDSHLVNPGWFLYIYFFDQLDVSIRIAFIFFSLSR